MDKTYLQWNLPNWITVVLMATLGAAIIGFVVTGVNQYRGNADDA